jgi:hypothetical protein
MLEWQHEKAIKGRMIQALPGANWQIRWQQDAFTNHDNGENKHVAIYLKRKPLYLQELH